MQPVEHVRQRLAVVRDVLAAVVTQVYRGVPEVLAQALAVRAQLLSGARSAPPRTFRHAPAVHEDRDPAGGPGKRLRDRVRGQLDRMPPAPDLHRQREAVLPIRHLVAVNAVDRGDGTGDPRARLDGLVVVVAHGVRRQRPRAVQGTPHRAVDQAVHRRGSGVVNHLDRFRRRTYRGENPARDTVMHVADQGGQYPGAFARKVGQRLDFVSLHVPAPFSRRFRVPGLKRD